MPGEEFVTYGDVGRELGFVASGVLDVIHKDALAGEIVLRSIYGDTMDMPTVIGELAFFLNMQQAYKVDSIIAQNLL